MFQPTTADHSGKAGYQSLTGAEPQSSARGAPIKKYTPAVDSNELQSNDYYPVIHPDGTRAVMQFCGNGSLRIKDPRATIINNAPAIVEAAYAGIEQEGFELLEKAGFIRNGLPIVLFDLDWDTYTFGVVRNDLAPCKTDIDTSRKLYDMAYVKMMKDSKADNIVVSGQSAVFPDEHNGVYIKKHTREGSLTVLRELVLKACQFQEHHRREIQRLNSQSRAASDEAVRKMSTMASCHRNSNPPEHPCSKAKGQHVPTLIVEGHFNIRYKRRHSNDGDRDVVTYDL